jgi:hypothetical protein
MIKDHQGHAIKTMEDWKRIYDTPQKQKHWKEGRSAHAIADYILNRNGIDKIRKRLEEIYKQDIYFQKAVPEFEITFDSYGKGRVHDLAIEGVTQSDSTLFVGVESKVDESFGNMIADVYLDAKARQIAGESTKAPERIEDLLGLHFSTPDRHVFNLRYQLLYATQGTLAAGADKPVLYILVFKTVLYDDLKGIENFRDYITFLNALNAEELECSRQDSRVHRLTIGDKELISIYEQVDLKS